MVGFGGKDGALTEREGEGHREKEGERGGMKEGEGGGGVVWNRRIIEL